MTPKEQAKLRKHVADLEQITLVMQLMLVSLVETSHDRPAAIKKISSAIRGIPKEYKVARAYGRKIVAMLKGVG